MFEGKLSFDSAQKTWKIVFFNEKKKSNSILFCRDKSQFSSNLILDESVETEVEFERLPNGDPIKIRQKGQEWRGQEENETSLRIDFVQSLIDGFDSGFESGFNSGYESGVAIPRKRENKGEYMSNPRYFELLKKGREHQERMRGGFYEDSTQIIRFEIDGRWSVEDMRTFLTSVEDLYNLRLILQISFLEQFPSKGFSELIHDFERMDTPFRLFRHPEEFAEFLLLLQTTSFNQKLTTFETCQEQINLLHPRERLNVRRIEYASPGLTDLAGVGAIIGHLKDFLQFVIKEGKHWKSSREEQNLSNEEKRPKNDEQRIKNAREFVTLARETGLPEMEVRKLISWVREREEPIAKLVSEEKIKDVRLLESGE